MDRVRTVILGGGRGARLFPLTKDRAKPGVPLAGKYRLIDIALSNCIHSGLDEIYILTQFNSASLNRHISETYYFGSLTRRVVRVLAAEQTPDNETWFRGTADAVRRHLSRLIDPPDRPDHVLILSGDHLYRMDYRRLIAAHLEKGADITVSALPVPAHETDRFGILKTGADGRIARFAEKPRDPALLQELVAQPLPAADRPFLASMGIYVFKTDVLADALSDPAPIDFGQHILPTAIDSLAVYAYPFSGYWKDIGTIRSFYEANLELLLPLPPFDFYNEAAPIYTYRSHLPNAKINESRVLGSSLGEGSIVDSSDILHSIVGLRTFVGAGTKIERSVVMGYDYYESAEQIAANSQKGIPRMGIGRGCYIRNAIVDKNARIGDNAVLANWSNIENADLEHCYIRDHLIIVPRNGAVPAGAVV